MEGGNEGAIGLPDDGGYRPPTMLPVCQIATIIACLTIGCSSFTFI